MGGRPLFAKCVALCSRWQSNDYDRILRKRLAERASAAGALRCAIRSQAGLVRKGWHCSLETEASFTRQSIASLTSSARHGVNSIERMQSAQAARISSSCVLCHLHHRSARIFAHAISQNSVIVKSDTTQGKIKIVQIQIERKQVLRTRECQKALQGVA